MIPTFTPGSRRASPPHTGPRPSRSGVTPGAPAAPFYSLAALPLLLCGQLPAPNQGQWWTFSVGAVAVLGVMVLLKQLRRDPPIEAEFVTQAELNRRLDGLSKKVDSVRVELADAISDSQNAGEARVIRLEGKIEAMRDAQTADTKAILESIGELRAGKVDRK
jgi:hypothetical protein